MKAKNDAKSPVIAIILTLVVSLGLNLFLGLSQFEGVYKTAVINRFGILSQNMKSQLENSMSLGKPLHLFGNSMTELFQEALKQESDISQLYITDPAGLVLYSSRNGVTGKKIPLQYSRGIPNPKAEDMLRVETQRLGWSIFVSVPLYRNAKFYEGQLFLEFENALISRSMTKVLTDLGLVSLLIFTLTLCLFILIYHLRVKSGKTFTPRGIMFLILGMLFLSQASFALSANRYYAQAYSRAYDANVKVLSLSMRQDLDKILGYGLPIDRLKGADSFLAERIKGSPECSNILIFNDEGRVNYQAGARGLASIMESSADKLSGAILPAAAKKLVSGEAAKTLFGVVYVKLAKGYMGLEINQGLIKARLDDQALDSLTIAIVSLIVAFMLLELIRLAETKNFSVQDIQAGLSADGQSGLRFIRLASFIFNFSAFVPLAFLPQHIQRIYDSSSLKLFNWDRTVMVSVPIGTYMVGITVAMLLLIFVFKYLSLRQRYIIISLLYIAGSLMTVFAKDILIMSLARFIAGMGFGGALLATTSLVQVYTDEKNRSAGFGISAAGFAAAALCSVPIGGVIVNRLGTTAGLYTSTAFGVLFFIFILAFLKREDTEAYEAKPKKKLSIGQWLRILTSRHILTYTFFMNIPFQILYWGLFQYVFPLYMSNTMGISESNIGRILSLFCVISLFAALMSRFADKLMNDKLLLSLGAIIVGVALLLFNFFPAGGILLFIGVIGAMGIQNLVVDSIEEVFISKGKVPVDVDDETLLQSYKTVEKVISTVVPTLSSVLMLAAGFNLSMFILGIYTLVGALAFFFFAANGRKKNALILGDSK